MTRNQRRLARQFDMLERTIPGLEGRTGSIRSRRGRLFRIPLGIILVVGGVFSILPFLGLWMIPLGLLLLAIDLPFLQPTVNALLIRGRRRIDIWRRWLRRKKR